MSSTFGNNIKISIFGQSHGKAIGIVIDGLPAGKKLNTDELQRFMNRRAPGNSKYTTSRKETDKVEFLSGLVADTTCGAPLTAVIYNENMKSNDYEQIQDTPRPGHADYTAHEKYRGFEDFSGGGHFSGRLTAPLCIAGGIAIQFLRDAGIEIDARILSIGGDEKKPMEQITRAKEEGDSVGGIIGCMVSGVPVGVGEPMFDGMENTISRAVFAIPAVKGIEFGAGFESTSMKGSENNDEFYFDGEKVKTYTNNSGGILGGIANGMDITFRVAVKPTPSIEKEQRTISYSKKENTKITVQGRHDPCIVPRAVPCVEAAAALAILDLYLEYERKKR